MALQWQQMHGGGLNGNDVSSLLARIDIFKEKLLTKWTRGTRTKDGYEELNQVIATLKSVEGVYTSVCSLNQVECDPILNIATFQGEWFKLVAVLKKLNVNLTTPPKCHIIFSHIPPYLEEYKMPLSYTSDQHIESYHAIFEKSSKNSNYKTRHPHTPEAAIKLKKGVDHVNGYNIGFSKEST